MRNLVRSRYRFLSPFSVMLNIVREKRGFGMTFDSADGYYTIVFLSFVTRYQCVYRKMPMPRMPAASSTNVGGALKSSIAARLAVPTIKGNHPCQPLSPTT
mgnify:CR=1 FL=1